MSRDVDEGADQAGEPSEDAAVEDFRAYRETGDRDLRNRLVEANLRLVEVHVRRYRGRSVAEDDLRQVASLALVQAVERFDPERGVRFRTFASRTIDGTIKRHFRDRTWSVRPPRSKQELHLGARRAEEELGQQLGRSPTVPELAEWMDVSEEEVLEAAEAAEAYRSVSLDRPPRPDDDGEAPVVDRRVSTDEEGYGRSEIRMLVEEGLDRLDQRERDALRMRFVEDRTQDEIAEELGLSQSYLSRLLRGALSRLREELDG